MSYVTLDTGFYTHPKVLALGNTIVARIARDLYVGALMYSRQHLTDGFVPLEVLAALDPITAHKDVERAALALHSVGLFIRKRGRFTGYWIHDYGKHQQTKAEVEAAREAARSRKTRQRERQRQVGTTIDDSLMSHRDTLSGHSVTPWPVTPTYKQKQNQKEKKKEAVGRLPLLSPDKETELERILFCCRGIDDESMNVLRWAAKDLPLAKIVWVGQSVKARRQKIGVGYAVNALKSASREAAA